MARTTVSQDDLLVEAQALPVRVHVELNKHTVQNSLYFWTEGRSQQHPALVSFYLPKHIYSVNLSTIHEK